MRNDVMAEESIDSDRVIAPGWESVLTCRVSSLLLLGSLRRRDQWPEAWMRSGQAAKQDEKKGLTVGFS